MEARGSSVGKILAYASITKRGSDSSNTLRDTEFKVYPNPIRDNDKITIQVKNGKGKYTATIHDLFGKLIVQVYGDIQEINQNVNTRFRSLDKGTYLISLSNTFENEKYNVKVIKE